MRIVIDMQGAQTASRFRGIGRYTMAFARAVATHRKDHEIFLALNGLLPDSIEPIRSAFEDLLPQSHIVVWHAPGPVSAMHPANEARRVAAELIREAFLAQLKPDLIHVSSLFEGYGDDAVVSLRQLDQQTLLSVSFYDLIPHLNPAQYLEPNPLYTRDYRRRVSQLQRATLCLAISDHSKQEALAHLPDLSERVCTVSTSVDDHFRVCDIPPAVAEGLRLQFGIRQSFVLYTGGADERKNLPNLLRAYAGLPAALRSQNQLVLAGKIPQDAVDALNRQARSVGLQPDEVLFTGFVTDAQLVQLYNLCHLFVFPSWQEGFGLPALEAMACGAVVIGANTSSLPEVMGLEAAMFDPMDVHAITTKMQQGLEEPQFRDMLRQHGLQQAVKFSWDAVAQRALKAWEEVHQAVDQNSHKLAHRKPRLAYVSPMPPERTGIADYSAELLPALAAHYDIDLILEQDHPMTPLAGIDLPIRDANWLRAHADQYERVIYQMGNSPFHAYMLDLIVDVPGTVVLHDFFLSGLFSWLDKQAGHEHAWAKALSESHGYGAVKHRFDDAKGAYLKYPVNWTVLQHAQGVIVHSTYSRQLMQRWYGPASLPEIATIPLLRQPATGVSRSAARQQLGWSDDDFVVCSFGFLDKSKLNHVLLQTWLESGLAMHAHAKLVFVGQNEGGDYGASLMQTIAHSGREDQICITGFTTAENYALHLAAADMAVQLRTSSRGETSAAALDCMNHGLPLIVNANGSMGELDRGAVWVLPDEFEPPQLMVALETLFREPLKRQSMGEQAQRIIHTQHAPVSCAAQYAQAMEKFQTQHRVMPRVLMPALADALPPDIPADEVVALARALACSFPLPATAKTLYLDVTATCANDLKTGIERVARSLVLAFLQSPPPGYRAAPVYLCAATGQWCHRQASQYTLGLLGCPSDLWDDAVVEPQNGDLVLVLDLSGDRFVQAQQAGLFDRYRLQGATVHAVVYDLLPVNMPEVFPPGADQAHEKWLTSISSLDGAVCISKAVQDELAEWQAKVGQTWLGRRPFRLGHFHLGADVAQSAPSRGLPEGAESMLRQLRERPSFLMVGTIEPRKNHAQVLTAFTQLWRQGVDVNLVIVGREGWVGLEPSLRRNIPELVERLGHHPERHRRLFWPQDVSDEFLTQIYEASTCLIAASWGEGFGLPLIEAAHHKLPVLARDLPVFREIAVGHVTYFAAQDPEGLAQAVQDWLKQAPDSHAEHRPKYTTLTWQQSIDQMGHFLWPHNENR